MCVRVRIRQVARVSCALGLALAGSQTAAQDKFDASVVEQIGDETQSRASAASPQLEATKHRSAKAVPPPSTTKAITVGSILIVGNETLPDSEFLDLIEEYTAKPLSEQDLTTLATRIAVRAQAKGLLFATASVPEQRLDLGVLRVQLDEGRIDEIRLEGAQDAAIARQLAPLASGTPVTKDRLERQLLLADDISGVRVLGSRFEQEGKRRVLIVKTRRSKASAYAELTNNGSRPVGPVRARIRADFNGLLSSADEVDVTVGTTPLQPGELQFARGSYKIVVDASGLELGAHLSYSSTAPGDFLSDRDIEGEFLRAQLSAQYPLQRSRDFSVWVIGEFEVTQLEQDRLGELVRQDRVPVVRAGLYSRGRFGGAGTEGGSLPRAGSISCRPRKRATPSPRAAMPRRASLAFMAGLHGNARSPNPSAWRLALAVRSRPTHCSSPKTSALAARVSCVGMTLTSVPAIWA